MKNVEKLAQIGLDRILIDSGCINGPQLEETAREAQEQNVSIEQLLINNNVIDEDTLATNICYQLNLPFLSLSNYKLTQEIVSGANIPNSVMRAERFVPLQESKDIISIITAKAPTLPLLDQVKDKTNKNVYIFVGRMSEVEKAISDFVKEVDADGNTIIPDVLQTTDVWETIFDQADSQVHSDLAQKAKDHGIIPDDTLGFFDEADKSVRQELGKEDVGALSIFDDANTQVQKDLPEKKETKETKETKEAKEPEELERTKERNIKDIIPKSPQEELSLLKQQLEDEPFDYDALNRYVEVAVSLEKLEEALAQLLKFARNLDKAGYLEETVDCYRYILELDPNNEEAKEYVATHGNEE